VAGLAFMSQSKSEKSGSKKAGRKNRAAEVANAIEWVVIPIMLALFFRAFVMEAFRIPTGSMANTLMGAHFRLRCPQCGYRYNYGFVPEKYGFPADSIPRGAIKATASRCPSCGHYQRTGGTVPIANGDRILVLKCIYQFLEPRRWDVIVFKNPLDPGVNYIKRLIGLPGEKVEIIDGDIYINGLIRRKPPKVQNELWMPVYDNDYQPVLPREPFFNGHTWQQPFKIADSEWEIDKANPTEFRLDCGADEINTMAYDTSIGNDFRATYAYDAVEDYKYMPYCSDLMVRFYSSLTDPEGRVGITLSKYQSEYSAWVDFSGDMVIESTRGKKTIKLARKAIEPAAVNKPALVKFANVDHQLIFQFGTETLTYDLGCHADEAGQRRTGIQPQVKIFGAGKLTLSHVAIFRDIHYTAKKTVNSPEAGRAIDGNPFMLRKDQFFVLGDNSPNSADGRWWDRKGIGNHGRSYDKGIVPRDYLVGKALFVYWPSWFRPFGKSSFLFIPNVGLMRFIYGGSNRD